MSKISLRWQRLARSGQGVSRGALVTALGALAWASALVLWTLWLPAERRQLLALQEANASSLALTTRRGASTVTRPASVSSVDRFLAAFPAIESRPQRVESLLAAAADRKLVWQRSDFRASRDAVPGLVRYQITLPLVGSYRALRGLVDDALLADPALVLDRLQLRRSAATAEQIEAASTWSLYTRDESSVSRPVSGGGSRKR